MKRRKDIKKKKSRNLPHICGVVSVRLMKILKEKPRSEWLAYDL